MIFSVCLYPYDRMTKVPVNEPLITDESKRLVQEAMDTGWISSAGPCIETFEKEFAAYLGVKHAVTTMNGTTALHLALASLGIGPGDEVIVPAFTMIASVDAILYTGAKPVFIDSERETFNMDVSQLAKKITKKTKAIMPVHIYGHSVDMDPVLELAKKHQLFVVEDAAEAHGATYKGHKCGSMGHINAFSFYGNKIITTGEGGMIVTNDDQLAARARTLKDLAHSPKRRFWHEEIGYNYRMTNLQAAVGLGQLRSIDQFLKTKQWMADRYAEGLKDVPGLRLPITKDYAKNVYWMYAVLVEDACPLSKDNLRKALLEKGVDTRDFFYSAASMPLVEKFLKAKDHFPIAEDIEKRGLYLPSGLALTDEQITYVCDSIHDIVSRA
jgi:perosamine synthetase